MGSFSTAMLHRISMQGNSRHDERASSMQSTIQLTQEQVEALTKRDAPRPRFLNPQTQEMFVLLPLAEYERLAGDADYADNPWTDEERDLLRAEGCQMLDNFGKEA
jgi:hypothetical protein